MDVKNPILFCHTDAVVYHRRKYLNKELFFTTNDFKCFMLFITGGMKLNITVKKVINNRPIMDDFLDKRLEGVDQVC